MNADTSPGEIRSSDQSTGHLELSEVRSAIGDVLQRLYTVHIGMTMPYLPDHTLQHVMERYGSRATCLKGRAHTALQTEIDEVVTALQDLGVL